MSYTTLCSECEFYLTSNCKEEFRNRWHCPSFKKKLTEHEKHIKAIAESTEKTFTLCTHCPLINNKEFCYDDMTDECSERLFNWMMSLKPKVGD